MPIVAMHKPRSHMRSSRRVAALIDSDIDHEINLINRAISPDNSVRLSATTADTSPVLSTPEQPLSPMDSQAPLTKPAAEEQNPQSSGDATTGVERTEEQDVAIPPGDGPKSIDSTRKDRRANPYSNGKRVSSRRRHRLSKELETDIDVLYENQRGCFFCGLPLFSSAALGNLDPTPWTNFAHRPSPTDIRTAQVPDPSWAWAWPDWRINRDDYIDVDKEGWEYSFMFSKKFSWHGPKWWNSFVRRRAWIRRRIKKADLDATTDPYLMAAGYFEVTAHKKSHRRSLSRASSAPDRSGLGKPASLSRRKSPARSRTSEEVPRASHDSARVGGDADFMQAKAELRTIDDLMLVLRRSRIDREKLEAVENYIEHCDDDLARLQDFTHEIMANFVFQASRQLLITRLTHLYDGLSAENEAGNKKGKEKEKPTYSSSGDEQKDGDEKRKARIERKRENLAAAITHADEELRKLEYWSDIKGMAEKGESGGAVNPGKGWAADWEGLDQSGPKGALTSELP